MGQRPKVASYVIPIPGVFSVCRWVRGVGHGCSAPVFSLCKRKLCHGLAHLFYVAVDSSGWGQGQIKPESRGRSIPKTARMPIYITSKGKVGWRGIKR